MAAKQFSREQIRRAARESVGLERLTPGQVSALDAVLSGRDTLAILPTGGGKSAIYQVAGALIPGTTIVISPLLALQRDQLQSLHELNAGVARELNSTLTPAQRDETLEALAAGRLEFILLAPEQMAEPRVVDALISSKPSLFVVDEAHCISDWGADFRPDYLTLGQLVERLGRPTTLALTATAAPPVRTEIVERLGMRDPAIIVRGFDRPNIRLEVVRIGDERQKREALVEAVVQAEPPGVVFASTRHATEDIAEALRAAGVAAAAYHAGLATRLRKQTQDAFMADSGGVDVIVATTAFGMGVDKPNIRFVFHAQASESLDAYHQEIGRSGRDGDPALAVLFYRAEDLGLRKFFVGRSRVDGERLRKVVDALVSARGTASIADLAAKARLSKPMTERLVARLTVVGACVAEGGTVHANGELEERSGEIVYEATAQDERRLEYDRSRVEMMRAYAETLECRRTFLLNYFGEGVEERCGNCDNDDQRARFADDDVAVPFDLNQRVRHLLFGEGTVQHYEEGAMTVLFDNSGYHTFDVEHVVRESLFTGLSP